MFSLSSGKLASLVLTITVLLAVSASVVSATPPHPQLTWVVESWSSTAAGYPSYPTYLQNAVPLNLPSGAQLGQTGGWMGNPYLFNDCAAYSCTYQNYVWTPVAGISTTGQPFPSLFTTLNRVAPLACGPSPTPSIGTVAATTIIVTRSVTLTVTILTDDKMAVWYVREGSTAWTGVPLSPGGTPSSAWKLESATQYAGALHLSKGVYLIVTQWSDICDIGEQGFLLTGNFSPGT